MNARTASLTGKEKRNKNTGEGKERSAKRPAWLRALYQIYGLIVVAVLYYLLIPVAEALRTRTGVLDFRNLVMFLALPFLIYWLVNKAAPGSGFGNLFIKGALAMGILCFLRTPAVVIRDLWLTTACFGTAFLYLQVVQWRWKRQADRLRAKKQWKRIERQQASGAENTSPRFLSKEDPEVLAKAKQRLESRIMIRERKDKASPRPLPARILFEGYHLLVVFAVNVGFLALFWVAAEIVSPAIRSPRDDLCLVLWLFSPALYYLAIRWATRRIRPGRVLVGCVLFAAAFELFNPSGRAGATPGPALATLLGWPVFCFAMAFIVLKWSGRREQERLARLKAQRLADPVILDRIGPEGVKDGTDEEWDEREGQDRMKRMIRRKLKSKWEQSRFYRHPWYFR